MRLVGLLLLSFATVTQAQEANAPPIPAYRTNTAVGLTLCRMSMKLAAASADATPDARRRVDPNMADWRGCIDKQRTEAMALFRKASAAARKPALREALKGYHVTWSATMEGIAPSSDERVIDYERRQAAGDTKIYEAWARVEIEQ